MQISKDTLRRTGLDITAAAHRLGLTNVTTNDDGSCTVEMTKDERDAVCAALKESLHEQIIALPEDGHVAVYKKRHAFRRRPAAPKF